ncbi:hypothetical protein ABZ464_06110 [Streptomyces sp. NPDC005820]|uniref:hypothetical protein n=1 Tax=Streptomyces sp. NPDC005820 TaxID=3157069 RepID=UPI0033FC6F13
MARTAILWGAGLLLAVAGTGLFLAIRSNSAELAGLEDAGRKFLTALGSGDGRDACALMTRTARSEFAAAQHRNTCPEAVQALVGPLSATERRELADSYDSRFFAKDGLGHVNVRHNALQISGLLLSKADGTWLVTDWR